MEETDKRKKREISEIQSSYIQDIKKLLNNAKEESGLSSDRLCEILERTYDFNINKGSLDKLFNTDDPNVNFVCMMAVCKFFGFDFNALLAPDAVENADGNIEVENYRHIAVLVNAEVSKNEVKQSGSRATRDTFLQSVAKTRKKFPILDDEGYLGEFKGFILSPPQNEILNSFNLTLDKDERGVMRARAVRAVADRRPIYLSGVPLLANAYNAVLMFLTDENNNGEFYFLAFGFKKYRSEAGLIYRKGLAVTGETFGSASVISQNFLMFRNDIKPEDTVMS
jgi:hypothetical protein